MSHVGRCGFHVFPSQATARGPCPICAELRRRVLEEPVVGRFLEHTAKGKGNVGRATQGSLVGANRHLKLSRAYVAYVRGERRGAEP